MLFDVAKSVLVGLVIVGSVPPFMDQTARQNVNTEIEACIKSGHCERISSLVNSD